MDVPDTPHIFSVEDNPETRMLLKHLLGGEYELTFAPDAEEALDTIGADPSIDLLLVDINLGQGISGTELLHEIEDREDVGEVPAVALTAYAMPGDREELLEEGFDEYVSKPFEKTDLLDAIGQALSAA